MQRTAATLLLQPYDAYVGKLFGELGGDPWCVVDAGVVGDRDPRRKGEVLPKVAMQAVDQIGEGGLLVVHRDHDIEHRHAGGAGRQGGVRTRFEVDSVSPGCLGSRAMSVITFMVGQRTCVPRLANYA